MATLKIIIDTRTVKRDSTSPIYIRYIPLLEESAKLKTVWPKHPIVSVVCSSFDTNLRKVFIGFGEDWYLTQFINFSNPILNNTPTTPQ